jgi:phosphate-selective porin OprO and OprP
MTASRWLASTALISAALAAAPVHAQDNASEVEALRAEVAALKEQLAAIAAKVEAVKRSRSPK